MAPWGPAPGMGMLWMEPYLRTALLTIVSLEVALLCARLASREGRREHLRLLVLPVALALDELAPAGPLGYVAAYAVPVAAGYALVPRYRATAALYVGGAFAAAASTVAWIAGLRNGPAPAAMAVVFVAILALAPMARIFLERRWMGTRVFVAVLAGGLLWLAGRVAELALGSPLFPVPGLPFALVIGVGIMAWWFGTEGPLLGRWHAYAASLEGRLAATEGQLKAQDRLTALGFMAAGAAHEFRNTLAAIGTLGQWALRSPSPERKDAALERIAERLEEASRNVATFLERLSVEGREPARPIHLSTDLDRLVGFVRATCRREGISLSYEVTGEPVIHARPGEIEHILLNLLHNAARAVGRVSRGEKRIEVRALSRPGSVVMEVQDTGGGVPAAMVPLLFGPVPSGAEGSGVGLYLARGLAERNDGRIEYASVPGGSLFRISFGSGLRATDPGGGSREAGIPPSGRP